MYVLAKFQLRTLKAFEVTALQISSNRKIDLYSKHRKINGCIQSLDWTSGLDSWTRGLDASDAAITLVIAGVMYFTDSRTELEIAFKQ